MNFYPYRRTIDDIPEPFRRYTKTVEAQSEQQSGGQEVTLNDILFMVLAYIIIKG